MPSRKETEWIVLGLTAHVMEDFPLTDEMVEIARANRPEWLLREIGDACFEARFQIQPGSYEEWRYRELNWRIRGVEPFDNQVARATRAAAAARKAQHQQFRQLSPKYNTAE